MPVTFRLGLYEARGIDAASLERHGWKRHGGRKAWVTSHIGRAAQFEEHAEGEARDRITKYLTERRDKIKASMAVASTVEIARGAGAIAAGHDYRPYQKAFVPFAMARHSTLNADVPRLGKTIQSVAVWNATPNPQKLLIVCQANAKTQWQADYEKWQVHGVPSGIVRGHGVQTYAPATIINYDILRAHKEWIHSQEWDLAVFDEAHNLMNPDSARTALLLGKGRTPDIVPVRAHRRLFLTGSPIWTRPVNLWPLVRACDPQGLGANYWRFVQRYCGASKLNDWDTSGRQNEEELQFKLRSSMMMRREKSDVLNEIPPNRQTVLLPKDGLERLVESERSLVANGVAELQELLRAKDYDRVIDKYADLAAPDENADMSAFATTRRELALAKLPMCIDWIRDNVLSTESKVVVFAHHRDVVTKVAEAFPDSAMIIGGMSEAKRDAEKERFQTDPQCSVISCNIRAAGTAISLSASDVVVFVEMAWEPSAMDQAEERIWLPEKTTPMSIYRLVVEDSMDSLMAHVLDVRQDSIDRTMSARFLS